MRKGFFLSVSIFLIVLVLIGILKGNIKTQTVGPEAVVKDGGKENRITVIAVGTLLYNMPIVWSAYNGSSYDFRPIFEDVKQEIESADLAIADLEATINPKKKLSGYPRYNSPIEILDGIKYAGFDVLNLANNHIMDNGLEGLLYTRKAIEDYGMIPLGAGDKIQEKHVVIEKNGIRIGLLSYTYGTNGLPAPDGTVNFIDKEKIKKDIEAVRKDCDFLILYLHTGTEYVRKVEPYQYELFRWVADAGADAVIGNHPHVYRDSEIYETGGRKVFINYSLGNFLSNQNDKYTDIGLMLKLTVLKKDSSTKIEKVDVIPVYRLRYKEGGKTFYKVVFCSRIEDYKIPESQKSYVLEVYNDFLKKNDFSGRF